MAEGDELEQTGLARTMLSSEALADGAVSSEAATSDPASDRLRLPSERRPSEDDTLLGSQDHPFADLGSPSEDDTLIADGRPLRASETTNIPQRIGKYRMLAPLGEGGMGTVFAARDEELDRKVAIKLVRPGGAGMDNDDGAKLRLMREAKALAKISHPNVIHVYEVGEWRNRVYVAMELVDGWTLGRFQYRNVTRWEDLLDIYKLAGRGLAAAHAGGLVHRDFKPDNVLVTPEGEPRVIDFGLARTIDAGGLEEEASARPEIGLDEELQLTRTGAVLGTPAYMAPEQHRGEATDSRTDQFSFCVALYEALYAQRPFAGTTFAELAYNVLHGNISEPPPFIKVPRWIRRVLVRGLSVDPDQRYPSMEALLDALDHDPVRRWRVLGVMGLSAVLAGAALLTWRAVERRDLRVDAAKRARAEFDAQRLHDQELQIRAAQTRSLPERRNEFVIAAARARVAKQPTAALATLKHLDPADSSVMPEALALAGEALARGVVDLELELGEPPTMIVFSPEASHVLVADGKGHMRLIHCASGTVEAEMKLAVPVVAAVFSEGGSLVVGDGKGVLHVFAPTQLGLEAPAEAGEEQAGKAELTPRERGVVNAARQLREHRGAVTALAVSGERVAAGDASGLVTVWALEGGSLERSLLGHERAITGLAFDTDPNVLFTADASGILLSRDLEARSKRTLEREQVVEGLRVQSGHLVGWKGGQLWSWDRRKGTRYSLRAEAERHLAVLDDAQVEVDQLGTLRLRVDRQVTAIVEGLAPWRGPFAVTPDHKRFAFGDARGRFVLRRLGDKSGLEQYGSEARPVAALALGRQHPYLALSNSAGEVEVRSLEGEGVPLLEGKLSAGADLLSFSPSDAYLFGARGMTRRLWSLGEGRAIGLPEGRCEVAAIAWSGDDQRVAVAQCDAGGMIDVFSSAGEVLHREHVSDVSGVQLDALGAHALAVSQLESSLSYVRVDEGSALRRAGSSFAGTDESVVAAVFVERVGEGSAAEGGSVSEPDVRIATLSGTRLHVWHWDVARDHVSLLSDETLRAAPEVAGAGRFMLLPIDDGLLRFWDLGRNHSVVFGDLGEAFDTFEVAADRQSLLLVTQGDAEPVAHHVHLGSGAARRFSGPTPFSAISGDGTALARRYGGFAEVWRDPVPQDITQLLSWLDEQTLRTLDPSELF